MRALGTALGPRRVLPPRHHVRGCPYTIMPVGFQFGFHPDQMPDLLECRGSPTGDIEPRGNVFFGPLLPEVNTNSQTAAAGRRRDSCQTRRPSTAPESSFCFSVKLQTADRRNLPTPRAASRGGDFIELTANQDTTTSRAARPDSLGLCLRLCLSLCPLCSCVCV